MLKKVLVSIVILLGLLQGPTGTITGASTAILTTMHPAAPNPLLKDSSLFKHMKSVTVTPVGKLLGGDFVRVGYVPGKDRIVVGFRAKLGQANGVCPHDHAYAYREYTVDMVETGDDGIVTCQTGPDVGGLFAGDAFYFASMGRDNTNTIDGWYLAKYDAVTWKALVDSFFYPLPREKEVGDPMLASVNGQIDISALYKSNPNEQPAPWKSFATHHQLFTTHLQKIGERVLSDIPHINLSSMIVANGVTQFLTGTALIGDLVVMQYDQNWKYLGGKTIMKGAAAPEGLAFDGTRFYVSYLDNGGCTTFPCYQNVRLAAFDLNWNLLDVVAVTSFTLQDHKQTSRPSLTLWNDRVYVVWDETENTIAPGAEDPNTADIQVHVAAYELLGT